MATTIPGMYAAGDVCYDGSCAPGAVPAPPGRNRGSGILNAVFAGVVSGQQAATYAAANTQLPIDDTQVEQLKEDAFAPLFREDGVKAKEVIDKIQQLVCPVENSVYMSQHRLDVCLRKLAKIKPLVAQLKAEDFMICLPAMRRRPWFSPQKCSLRAHPCEKSPEDGFCVRIIHRWIMRTG